MVFALRGRGKDTFLTNSLKIYSQNNNMLIGYLNRRLGFKEFKKIEVGSPVYEQGGVYYVWQEHESGTYSEMVRYYPYSLSSAINFTSNLFSE